MVFANTVEVVEAVAKILTGAGLEYFYYHNDSSLKERTKNLLDFQQEDGVFVCTDDATHGIDIPNVSHVIQIVLFIITPNMNRPIPLVTKEQLEIVILAKLIRRISRMIPLNKEITRTTGFSTETALTGAALILFQLMIVSNVLGAYLYLFTVERQYDCWFKICNGIKTCVD